jgi:hypothetical protein
VTTQEQEIDRASAHYPPAEITPAEFEQFVADFLTVEYAGLKDLQVTVHDVIEGTDGEYDFDATARYSIGGAAYLLLAEAKRHKNPIKRELVASLHSKLLSVGAQKAALFSTAPFQSGAVSFAKTHGIALVKVTEGRFTYETRSIDGSHGMSREDALEHMGLPYFVGVHIERGDEPNTTSAGVINPTSDGAWIAEHVLGVPTA